jgi:hypothetical protein
VAVMRVTAFLGYGPLSEGVRRNVRLLVEKLREMGFSVVYEEVRVPALDPEEFEPFVKIDEREVYIPSVSASPERLVEHVLAYEVVEALLGFIPPPGVPVPA